MEIIWWLANIVLLVAVIPLVAILAGRVVRPIREIEAYAADILEHGVALTGNLDGVPQLARSAELVRSIKTGAAGYAATVGELL